MCGWMTGRNITGMRRIALVRSRKSGKEKPMSSVRVLVGTRKGAFILNSDGKREKWDVSHERIAGRSQSHLRLPDQRMVRSIDPALGRWRKNLGPTRSTGWGNSC